ncbi:hypothetical protein JL720_5789 [Aureococcus anophagefferens]|nr:hypothetical protein JL720_5789 [Aureococcus anophagefferens]
MLGWATKTCVLLAGWLALAAGEGIVELGDETFEKETQSISGSTTGDWFVRFCPELCPKEDKFQLKELASKLDGHDDKWINVATVDCEINVNVTETNSDFLRNFTKRLKNVTLEDGGRGEGLRIPRGPMWFTPLIKPITDKLDLFFEMVDYRMLSTGMGAFSVLLVLVGAFTPHAEEESDEDKKKKEDAKEKKDDPDDAEPKGETAKKDD